MLQYPYYSCLYFLKCKFYVYIYSELDFLRFFFTEGKG